MNALAAIAIGLVSQVSIDQNWLAQRGPGPYYLSQAKTTYTLRTDVSTPGTAFIVVAPNVTFDLQGHTITYDNSQPIKVPNGGFEEGTGPTDVPGWDISQAVGAVRMAARTGMWGNWMLRLPELRSTATLVSSPIPIPQANVEYAAVITPKSSAFASKVTLFAVDAVTGAVLGSGDSRDPARGFAPVVKFTPTTTEAIRLKVVAAPPSGKTITLDLDYASLTRSRNHGIVATSAPWTLPPQLQTPAVTAQARSVAGFTLKHGSLIHGTGQGYGGYPVFAKSVKGITIDRINATASGADSHHLELSYTTDPVVTNCNLIGQLDRTSDRMSILAGIDLSSVNGTVRIQKNRMTGKMHAGILIARASPITDRVLIADNVIQHDAIGTDGYGIVISNLKNFEIARNTIDPVNGRGILFDAYNGGITDKGWLHDNKVGAREHANLEYTAAELEAIALRMRAYGKGGERNIRFTNNTFVGETWAGGNWATAGARLSFSNAAGMVGSNISFQGNTFRAVIASSDSDPPGHRTTNAWALSLANIPVKTGLRFVDNVFESNRVAVNFGDNDGWEQTVSDVLFVGNTIRKLDGGAAGTYESISAGDWKNATTGVRLIATRYRDGATPKIQFIGKRPKDVSTGWLLNLTVTNADGSAAAGAAVTVFDKDNAPVARGTTNDRGKLTGMSVVTTVYRQAGEDPTAIATDDRGPFTVRVKRGTAEKSMDFSMTGDLELTVAL